MKSAIEQSIKEKIKALARERETLEEPDLGEVLDPFSVLFL